MRGQYDLSGAKRSPYVRRLQQQITIRLDKPTIQHFKDLADETDVPYQTLINRCLQDCAARSRKPSLRWTTTA